MKQRQAEERLANVDQPSEPAARMIMIDAYIILTYIHIQHRYTYTYTDINTLHWRLREAVQQLVPLRTLNL